MPAQKSLQEDVELTIQPYEQAIGQPATRTRNMINQYGRNPGTITALMINPDLQQGFKVLRDRNEPKTKPLNLSW